MSKKERPQYLALDGNGLEYSRAAQLIHELPLADRAQALQEATRAIAERAGIKAIKPIHFGMPVFAAFEGMTRPKTRHHKDTDLLLTHGGDLSLDFCDSYKQTNQGKQ